MNGKRDVSERGARGCLGRLKASFETLGRELLGIIRTGSGLRAVERSRRGVLGIDRSGGEFRDQSGVFYLVGNELQARELAGERIEPRFPCSFLGDCAAGAPPVLERGCSIEWVELPHVFTALTGEQCGALMDRDDARVFPPGFVVRSSPGRFSGEVKDAFLIEAPAIPVADDFLVEAPAIKDAFLVRGGRDGD